MSYTGSEVAGIRTGLGLSAAQMAQLLGVTPTTIYRWEKAGDNELRVEPLQQSLLASLQSQLAKAEREAFVEAVTKGLLIGGGLLGLYVLLNAVFKDTK